MSQRRPGKCHFGWCDTTLKVISLGNFTHQSTSYTMGCPPIREDNSRALASGLPYVQTDNPWYNYLIPPTST